MKSDKGNALFLILIAVALFAALSYAITNSSRGSSSTDKEQAEIQAAKILNYMAAVQDEFTKLRVLYNAPAYDINFGNNDSHQSNSGAIGSDHQNNPNCSTLSECSIFANRDGNVISRAFYDAASMPVPSSSGHPVPGELRVYNNFIEDVGSNSEPELVMLMIGLKEEVCDAINKQLDLPLASTQPVAPSIGRREYWVKASNYAERLPGVGSAYIGEATFCSRHSYGWYGYILFSAVHVE